MGDLAPFRLRRVLTNEGKTVIQSVTQLTRSLGVLCGPLRCDGIESEDRIIVNVRKEVGVVPAHTRADDASAKRLDRQCGIDLLCFEKITKLRKRRLDECNLGRINVLRP